MNPETGHYVEEAEAKKGWPLIRIGQEVNISGNCLVIKAVFEDIVVLRTKRSSEITEGHATEIRQLKEQLVEMLKGVPEPVNLQATRCLEP